MCDKKAFWEPEIRDRPFNPIRFFKIFLIIALVIGFFMHFTVNASEIKGPYSQNSTAYPIYSQGPIGPQGPIGAKGDKGDKGDAGLNGVNGSIWYFGSEIPDMDLGFLNDYYLRNTTGDVYNKNSTWELIMNLMGPKGEQGEQGEQGLEGEVNYTLVDEEIYSNYTSLQDWVSAGFPDFDWVNNRVEESNNSLKDYVDDTYYLKSNPLGFINTSSSYNASYEEKVNHTSFYANKSYVDTQESLDFRLDSSRAITGNFILKNSNNSFLKIGGGQTTGAGGASIVLFGNNYTGYSSNLEFRTVNAGNTTDLTVMQIAGNTNTPVINVLNHEIQNVMTNSTGGAINKSYVDNKFPSSTSWTPVYTFSGNVSPMTGFTQIATYWKQGNIVFWSLTPYCTNSLGGKIMSFTLPSSPMQQYFQGIGSEWYGTNYNTFSNVFGYSTPGSNIFTLSSSYAGTNGQPFTYIITGFYGEA
jgi:hypothetical protein